MSTLLRRTVVVVTLGLATVCMAQTNPAEQPPAQVKQVSAPPIEIAPVKLEPVPAQPVEITPAQPESAPMQQENPMVTIRTSKGNIEVELFADKAPLSVKNFLQYVDDKHYNGTIFHRVIKGFMIQGGGFTKSMSQKPTRAPIKNEAANGLKNDRGTIAMARTGDPDSATAQFFINVVDNSGLNRPSPDGHGYCVFGKVVQGMDVVDQIRSVPTGSQGGMQDVPTEPIEIIEVTRAK
jgi:peptidyl-prolyl cis-trans isomerase A (cyclophilin A)